MNIEEEDLDSLWTDIGGEGKHEYGSSVRNAA